MQGLFQLNTELLFTWGARVAVLLICLPVHEFAHALAANKLGDTTAERQGRLTLNPFVHLDPFGSLLLLFVGLGWAKPVPVNANALRNPRRDMAIISFAGPFSNILLAIIITAVLKIMGHLVAAGNLAPSPQLANLFDILGFMIFINLALAVLNLLPIPPLDGSKLFGAVLPERHYFAMMRYERYVMIILMILLFTGVLGGVIRTLALRLFVVVDFLTLPIDIFFRG